MPSRMTVIGVMLAFMHRSPACSGNVWSDGDRLESYRVLLGRWKRGATSPCVQAITRKDLSSCGASRTVAKHHGWYKELVNFHKNNVN